MTAPADVSRIKEPRRWRPTWRTATALKIAIAMVETLGLVLAVAAGTAGWVFWRLEQGPLRLTALERTASRAIALQLPRGYSVDLERLVLSKEKSEGAYRLALFELDIRDGDDRLVGATPRIDAIIAAADLLGGRLSPARIVVRAPSIHIVRTRDRLLVLDPQTPGAGGRRPIAAIVQSSSYLRETFERADLIDARIDLADEVSGGSWRVSGVRARLIRRGDDFSATLDVPPTGPAAAQARINARLASDGGRLAIDASFEQAPVGDLLALVVGDGASPVRGPVSGDVRLELSPRGGVASSGLDLRGEPGATLRIGGRDHSLTVLEVRSRYDARAGEIVIENTRLETAAAAVKATASARLELDPVTSQVSSVSFAIGDARVAAKPSDRFKDGLALEAISADGRYERSDGVLDLEKISFQMFETRAAGAMRVKPTSGSVTPAIDLSIDFDGVLKRQDVLQAWPHGLGRFARRFVDEQMERTQVDDLKVRLALPAGAFADGVRPPSDSLQVTFALSDADVTYARGLRPVTNARGRARLELNRFFVDELTGDLGPTAMREGEVDFTAFRPIGAPSYFRFTLDGDASDMLSVIDDPPLEFISPTGLRPEQISGPALAKIEIMRPNKGDARLADYEFSGEVGFDGLQIAEAVGGLTIKNGAGALILDTAQFKLKADAALEGAPLKIDWTQKFRGGRDRSEFNISGVATSGLADALGFASRQMMRGEVGYKARAVGDFADLSRLDLDLDFTRAALMLDAFAWRKAAGAPAFGKALAVFDANGVTVRDLSFDGAGAEIKGAFQLSPSGRLERGAFPVFKLDGAADVAATAKRVDDDALAVNIEGAYFNAAPLLEVGLAAPSSPSGADDSDDWGPGLQLVTRIDEIRLQNDVLYRGVAFDFDRDSKRISKLQFAARSAGDAPVMMALKDDEPPDSSAAQIVEARTDDIGSLLSGLFGLRSISGGRGIVDLEVRAKNDFKGGAAGLAGRVVASDMVVVGAPLLARIFSAGSLIGLTDLLNGEGIEISDASARFAFRNGALVIRDLRATGPAVGLSAEGRVASDARGGVDLNGAVAPAYTVNSLLGRAPLIGDLLVNKSGEGVVALSYEVSGSATSPTVAVNPLSAFTPGAFRRVFEPDRASIEEFMEEKSDHEPPVKEGTESGGAEADVESTVAEPD